MKNLDTMICTRRSTRSSVGTRKKTKSECQENLTEPIRKTQSVDESFLSGITMETVSMPTRRQTRKSLDSFVDKEQDQMSNKQAVLDRVKKSLRYVHVIYLIHNTSKIFKIQIIVEYHIFSD